MRKLLIIITLLFFVSTYSQVKDTTYVKTDLLLGINLSGGNKPLYGGNIKSNLSFVHNAWEGNISPSFTLNYSTDNDGKLIVQRREIYNSLSLSHTLSNRFKIIAFSEFNDSYIQKIDMRFNFGIGPGFKYKTDYGNEFHISEVLLAENSSSVGNISGYFLIRASTRIKFIYKTKLYKITSISLIQPSIYNNLDISNSEHIIYRSNNRIDFLISKNITTGFSYDMIYQKYTSYMDNTIKPFDWNSSIFISFKN